VLGKGHRVRAHAVVRFAFAFDLATIYRLEVVLGKRVVANGPRRGTIVTVQGQQHVAVVCVCSCRCSSNSRMGSGRRDSVSVMMAMMNNAEMTVSDGGDRAIGVGPVLLLMVLVFATK